MTSQLKIFLLALFVVSCSDFGTPPAEDMPQSDNLVQNHSFEINGSPTIDTWQGSWFPDSSLMHHFSFSSDVPQGGGQWSLAIHTELDDLWAYTDIAAPLATSYQLTVWTKTNALWVDISLSVSAKGSNHFIGRVITVKNPTWQAHTVTLDSAVIASIPDSTRILRIRLLATREPFKTAATSLFDLIHLEAGK